MSGRPSPCRSPACGLATSFFPASTLFLPACMVCLFLAFAAASQNSAYHDPVALWSLVVSRSPGKARPHYNLGNAFRDSGDLERAVGEWRRAVAIDPRYSMAHNQLGNVAFFSGALAEAERDYRLAVEAEPGNAEAQYNLALVSESLGKKDQALEHYRQFLAEGGGQSPEALHHAAERVGVLRGP